MMMMMMIAVMWTNLQLELCSEQIFFSNHVSQKLVAFYKDFMLYFKRIIGYRVVTMHFW